MSAARPLFLLIIALLTTLLAPLPAAALLRVRAGLEQNPPLSFMDEHGQPAGLLIELLDEVAAREQWQVSYHPETFERCLDQLQQGEIDLMVTIASSKERAERFDFNRVSVVANWGQLYGPPGNTIQSYFDLTGKRLAVMRQDTHHLAFRAMLEKFGIAVEYLPVDNFDQVFAAIAEGRAAAGVVGRFYALRKEGDFQVQATPLIFNPIEVHYAVRKGTNAPLLQAIDTHLATFKTDPGSRYYQALDRWLGVPGKKVPPRWLTPLLLGAGLLLASLGTFVLLLRRQVRNRTRHLEQEIAERRRAEVALEESERSYRELVECAHAILLRWDSAGRITFVNDFAETFFGYTKEELLQRELLGTLVAPQSPYGAALTTLLGDRATRAEDYLLIEAEHLRKDGSLVWILWHNRPMQAAAGQPAGFLGIGLDITERKQAEMARRLLERAKDDFIATAAHELRTPLTAIIGYAELLRDDLDKNLFSPAQHNEFLDEISAKGQVLTRIIEDLLDIGRIQKGSPLPLHLQYTSPLTVISRVVERYRALKAQHRFRLTVEEGLPALMSFDPGRIEQVLCNLLGNAAKYSHPGSEIRIDVTDGNGSLRVVISDQGIGMTPEQLERIFDKFYRADSSDTAVGGLGIGMNIARQIVESHGGRIQVESRPGIGTRVSFTLPVTTAT